MRDAGSEMVLAVLWSSSSKRKSIYIALYSTVYSMHTLKALRHGSHSFTCKQHHACISSVSVHQMALPLTEVEGIQLYLSMLKG